MSKRFCFAALALLMVAVEPADARHEASAD